MTVSISGNGTITGLNPTTTAGNAVAYQSGQIVQIQSSELQGRTTGANTIPTDDTIPQITEGNLVCSVTITPKAIGNTLIVEGSVFLSEVSNTGDHFTVALFKDAAPDAIASALSGLGGSSTYSGANNYGHIPVAKRLVVSSLAPITFQLRAGTNLGSSTINGIATQQAAGNTVTSWLKVSEVAA